MDSHNLQQEIEQLLDAHQRELLAYACRLLNSAHLAQDMVQDALIKYIAVRRGGQVVDNRRAWLYRVTHNLCLDYIRKNRRGEAHLSSDPERVAPAAIAGPDEGLLRADSTTIADQLLATLSEREQEIVRLKIYGNRSYREIAEILALTTSNVGFILHTAMKKMANRAKVEGLLP